MFRTLLIKEIKHHIFSQRYVISSLLLILLVLGLTYTLGNTYKAELEQNQHDQMQREQFLDKYAHYNRIWSLILPIQPPGNFDVFFANYDSGGSKNLLFENPIYILYRKFDLIDVMKYILSIMALILGFDAISGEREGGTLRLLSAFAVSRPIIIIAKLVAAFSVVTVALLSAFAISIGYLMAAGLLNWGIIEWISFLSIMAVSMIYFCCFYSMSLFCSAVTSRSATSIVAAFLIWVGFAFVIPNISPFMASQVFPVPAIEKINSQVSMILDTERDELGREFVRDVQTRYQSDYPEAYRIIQSASSQELERILQSDPTIRDLYGRLKTAIDSAWGKANQIQNEKAGMIRGNLERRMARQLGAAQLISYFSPSADLTYSLESLSATGKVGYEYFVRKVNDYYAVFNEYILKKYNSQRQLKPQFTSDNFLDISDRPQFVNQVPSLWFRLESIKLPLLVLILYMVLFFLGAVVAFRKYDIR